MAAALARCRHLVAGDRRGGDEGLHHAHAWLLRSEEGVKHDLEPLALRPRVWRSPGQHIIYICIYICIYIYMYMYMYSAYNIPRARLARLCRRRGRA